MVIPCIVHLSTSSPVIEKCRDKECVYRYFRVISLSETVTICYRKKKKWAIYVADTCNDIYMIVFNNSMETSNGNYNYISISMKININFFPKFINNLVIEKIAKKKI